MLKRTATAIVLLAIAVPIVRVGGFLFFLLIGFFIVTASWEYVQMFRAADSQPSPMIVVGGTLALLLARFFLTTEAAEAALTLLTLAAMTAHLVAYERGRAVAGTDFAVSVGGFVYLGWVGAYLLDLRNLPNGEWWLLFVLPCVWVVDSFAYMLGSRFGKHKMTPRLSPKKSWEGYAAGIVTGTLFGAGLAWVYNQNSWLVITPLQGALLGLALSTLTTLGDLGESLIKRQGGVKDSGSFIPGHGGAFDRIDSLIWAGAIGVFWIRWFLL